MVAFLYQWEMVLIFPLQTVRAIELCSGKHLDQGCQESPCPFQVHVPGLMCWALYTVAILLCMKAGVDFAVLKGLRSTAHLLNQEKTQCSISVPSSPETRDCSVLQASFVHHSNFLVIFSLEFPAYCNSCVTGGMTWPWGLLWPLLLTLHFCSLPLGRELHWLQLLSSFLFSF